MGAAIRGGGAKNPYTQVLFLLHFYCKNFEKTLKKGKNGAEGAVLAKFGNFLPPSGQKIGGIAPLSPKMVSAPGSLP